jgi:hypothetical protein
MPLTSQEVLALAAARWERDKFGDATERVAVTVSEYRCTGRSSDRCTLSIHAGAKDARGGRHTICKPIGESRGPGANWDEAWAKAQERPDAVIAEAFDLARIKAQMADSDRSAVATLEAEGG